MENPEDDAAVKIEKDDGPTTAVEPQEVDPVRVLPVNAKRKDGKNDVFYNPAQVFNRDLSVLVLSVFGKLRDEEGREKDRRRVERALAKAKASSKPPAEDEEKPKMEETGETEPQVPRTAIPQILEEMKGLKVLEALAATGIRTVRYAKELPQGAGGVRNIVANDLDPNAVEHMRRNFAHNDLGEERVQAINSCANAHMYSKRAKGFGGLGLL
eukprot:symbB.v1.2.037272.t1/scaffold5459.1/size26914/3